jgi:hypothetical protein
MKYLILALALFTTSAFADLNTPPTKAVCGQVYETEVCVWAQYATGFDDEYGLRSSYLSGDKWVFLAEQTTFISNMTTKETTDFYFETFVDAINTQIQIKAC